MARLYISGNAVDQNEIPVIGAKVYVRVGGADASLEDADGAALGNPLITIADGFFEAYSTSTGTHTLEYYWGGKLRRVDTVSEIDRLQAIADEAAASAQAAAALTGPFYATTAEGLAATVDGQEFNVRPSPDDATADVYLNNEGTAVFSRTFIIAPDAPGTAALIGTTAGDLQTVLDAIEARLTALEP